MNLSLDAQKEIFAEESGEYPIVLLTLEHDDLAETLRFSTDPTQRIVSLTTDEEVIYGTVSNSNEYIYCPMEVNLPKEDEETPPQVELSVSNVGREMVAAIRSIRSSPAVTMSVVISNDLDTIEGEITGLKFTEIEINNLQVTGTLVLDILVNEPFPYLTFTPATAPGLFKA